MRILFVHGLDPLKNNGTKAKYLKANFEFVCVPLIKRPLNLVASILFIVENIRAYQPDVVVGSSLGALITLMLIQFGEWKGPAILLAPATGKIFPNLLWLPKNTVCTIVHGRADEIIDVQTSRILFSSASPPNLVKYIENDDDHGVLSIINGPVLKEMVEDVYSRYNAFVPEKPRLSITPKWWLAIKSFNEQKEIVLT